MPLDAVKGLSHFAEYFAAYRSQYVLIGGVAAIFSLEKAARAGRPTKDLDIVVLANPNRAFADRLREYVTLGGYAIESDGGDAARNYRFSKPAQPEFPVQIEIFSTLPLEFSLRDGQTIVPFSTSPGIKSLSAILMGADYFGFVKANVEAAGAIPLLNILALIPLKMRAFLDLEERREKGEAIDQRDIKKHRNDVLRLILALAEERAELPASIRIDVDRFFEHQQIAGIDRAMLKSIVGVSTTIEALKGLVAGCYS
jgi:hypothetical protein